MSKMCRVWKLKRTKRVFEDFLDQLSSFVKIVASQKAFLLCFRLVLHQHCVTCQPTSVQTFRHVCQRLRRKWAGRQLICLTAPFPHSVLHFSSVWLVWLSRIKNNNTQALIFVTEWVEWLSHISRVIKIWLQMTASVLTRLPFGIHHLLFCVCFSSKAPLLCFQLLCFFLVCLSCWWERWTAAPCCLCCPLRRAGWANRLFFFNRETDLPHKEKEKNWENDPVCLTHAFTVVAVKERPVPFPIFTQSVASLASSGVTS